MDRILTIPNAISVGRLACVPWFVYLVYGAENYHFAAWLLAFLGTTDWVDGYIARHYNQVSTFGKVFDPTADRIMLVVAAVAVLNVGAMPWWFGVAALGRELFVVIGGVILYSLGMARIDVQLIGKAGAMGLMISLPLFLVSHAGVGWASEARVLAYVFGIPGLVLAWYSVLEYRKLAIEAMHRGRERRQAERDAKAASAEPVRKVEP